MSNIRMGEPVAGTTPAGWFVLAAAMSFPLGYSLTQGIETGAEYLAALAGVAAAWWGVAEVRRDRTRLTRGE